MTFEQWSQFFAQQTPHKQAGFFLWPSLAGTELSTAEARLFEHYSPSGSVLFKRSMSSLLQAKNLVASLKNLTAKGRVIPYPMTVCIDEEGGRVSRLPSPMIRGKPVLEFSQTSDHAGLMSQLIHQCGVAKEIGIVSLLAPVADLLTNPANTAIGDRSFGSDPVTVSVLMEDVVSYMQLSGVFACVKHFPGHGDTTTDSHLDFARTNVTLETLRNREWAPFRAAFRAGAQLCMTAHVIAESIDSTNPATLSELVLQKYLRDELGFRGLILSDDLRMNAIAKHFGFDSRNQAAADRDVNANANTSDGYLADAAIAALTAGCDILLSCHSIEKEAFVFEAIAKEIQNSEKFYKLCLSKSYRIYQVLAGAHHS